MIRIKMQPTNIDYFQNVLYQSMLTFLWSQPSSHKELRNAFLAGPPYVNSKEKESQKQNQYDMIRKGLKVLIRKIIVKSAEKTLVFPGCDIQDR